MQRMLTWEGKQALLVDTDEEAKRNTQGSAWNWECDSAATCSTMRWLAGYPAPGGLGFGFGFGAPLEQSAAPGP